MLTATFYLFAMIPFSEVVEHEIGVERRAPDIFDIDEKNPLFPDEEE